MTTPNRTILRAFLSGHPITLSKTAQAGVRHGADRWQFAALKMAHSGAVMVSAPGKNAWMTVDEMLSAPLNYGQRTTARFALAMLAGLERAANGERARAVKGLCWMQAVTCNGTTTNKRGERVPCADTLVHPMSIAAGAGPTCRGEVAEREARAATKRRKVGQFVNAMRARAGHVAPPACGGPLVCTNWDCEAC